MYIEPMLSAVRAVKGCLPDVRVCKLPAHACRRHHSLRFEPRGPRTRRSSAKAGRYVPSTALGCRSARVRHQAYTISEGVSACTSGFRTKTIREQKWEHNYAPIGSIIIGRKPSAPNFLRHSRLTRTLSLRLSDILAKSILRKPTLVSVSRHWCRLSAQSSA
jgi:hypothetical protein